MPFGLAGKELDRLGLQDIRLKVEQKGLLKALIVSNAAVPDKKPKAAVQGEPRHVAF